MYQVCQGTPVQMGPVVPLPGLLLPAASGQAQGRVLYICVFGGKPQSSDFQSVGLNPFGGVTSDIYITIHNSKITVMK